MNTSSTHTNKVRPRTGEATPQAASQAAPQPAPQAATQRALAAQAVGLAREQLLSELPYLARALAQLSYSYESQGLRSGLAYASSEQGVAVQVDPFLQRFVSQRAPLAHDLLHILLHLLLGHVRVSGRRRAREWNLAADLCVEYLAAQLLGPRQGDLGYQQKQAFAQIKAIAGERLSAEHLYACMEAGMFAQRKLTHEALDQFATLMQVDDHHAWYELPDTSSPQRLQQATSSQGGPHMQYVAQSADKEQEDQTQPPQENNQSQTGEATPREDEAQAAPEPEYPAAPRRAQQEGPQWEKLAAELMSELGLLGRAASDKYAALSQELAVTQHAERSYEDFLRSFVQVQEEPHVSDDEFDYMSYTLGLELYGDMPLIEPLEYRSRAGIRDFVVVLDTSSSVAGAIVQQFVNTTYDVLCSSGAFFESFNLHIVQCDTQVRSDTKIRNLAELNQWAAHIELRGLGGTDFRPAFRYIEELLAQCEFEDLAGVVYLTDGWGIYPEYMPSYQVAFVFYDEDHRPELVPAWAQQLTINAGQFSSLSVYGLKRPHLNTSANTAAASPMHATANPNTPNPQR